MIFVLERMDSLRFLIVFCFVVWMYSVLSWDCKVFDVLWFVFDFNFDLLVFFVEVGIL